MYDEYRTDSRKNLLYGITHLTALKCEDNCDIKKLRNYFNRWNMLLTGLKAPWNTDSPENLKTREQLFHEQINKSPLLAGPLNAYELADDDDAAIKT